MHSKLSTTLAQQHQTLERWRSQARLNAEDMASDIIAAFSRATRDEIGDSFYWDLAEIVSMACGARLGDGFDQAIERHFACVKTRLIN